MYSNRLAVLATLLLVLSVSQGQLIFSSGFEAGESPVPGIPPNPEDVAPDRDGAGNTSACDAYGFLFDGAEPVQFDVDESIIDCGVLAVLGGRVVDTSMTPLAGVTVRVKDRPEFGFTLSRADGEYDLAVNGGGQLMLQFTRGDLLGSDREVTVARASDVTLEDVMLVGLDPNVTTLRSGSSEPQLVTGSERTDADGTRTARLMVPPNVSIMMGNDSGGMDAMDQLDVRITEYTVGETGPMAMPADLPPTSGYTYAVEFSADEGLTQTVTFDRPLASYNENYLGFPTGTIIPHGWYDRNLGQWVPATNGRVIEIIAEVAGSATVAVDSTGSVADANALQQLGITDDELEMLAQLYQPGDTLWRVPIRHFSPHDYNFPLPDDASPPPLLPPLPEDLDVDTSDPDFGVIEFQTQVFRERMRMPGVPFDLSYSSFRVPGRTAERSLRIPITRSEAPDSLNGARLVVNVAGRRSEFRLGPDPSQFFTFRWDGTDRYGRPVFGSQRLEYELSYEFPVSYRFSQADGSGSEIPSVFGRIIQLPGSQGRSLAIATRPRLFKSTLSGLLDSRAQGVGGWNPTVHHYHDSAGGVVYRGDGSRQSDGASELVFTTNSFGGGGTETVDGVPATQAFLETAEELAVASDGTVYYAEPETDFGEYRIRAIDPAGIIRTVVPFGGSDCPSDDESVDNIGITPNALSSVAATVVSLAVDRQDRLHFAAPFCSDMPFVEDGEEFFPYMIYRVEGDRAVRVAGTEFLDFAPQNGFFDDVAALNFQMTSVEDLDFFEDGPLAILDFGRFYRLEADGEIRRFAGVTNCFPGFCDADGVPAIDAVIELPFDMATLPDGGVVFAGGQFDSVIRKITRDGILQTLLPSLEGRQIFNLTAGPDGVVYAATTTEDFPFVEELLAIEPDGSSRLIAGGAVDQPYATEGGPARQQRFSPIDIDVGPDGAIYGTVFPGIVRIVPGDEPVPLADTLVASVDGPEVFRFSANGRHLDTRHELTGGLLWEFGYDSAGFLTSVTDGYGNRTSIDRDNSGQPLSIESPDGHVTAFTVDANGFLASSLSPSMARSMFEYTNGGLLTAVETATASRYQMTYDVDGRLTGVTDPTGALTTLSRTLITDGRRVSVTSPEGLVTHYESTVDAARTSRLRTVYPDGTVRERIAETDGLRTVVERDGTIAEVQEAPDPRFAMQAPYTAQSRITLPSGTVESRSTELVAVLENTGGLLDLATLTRTQTIENDTVTAVYSGATNTETVTFPGGQSSTVTLDEQGTTLSADYADGSVTSYTFDSRGRLLSQTLGDETTGRTMSYSYGANGLVESINYPDGTQLELGYDADLRVISAAAPGQGPLTYGYAADGFRISLTPPGRLPYGFMPSLRSELIERTIPVVGQESNAVTITYDDDRRAISEARPDGRSISITFDALGRQEELVYSRGSLTYAYDNSTGQQTGLTSPDVTLTRGFAGRHLNDETWSAGLVGSVATSLEPTRIRVAQVSVNGSNPVSRTYSENSRLIGVGDLTLTREAERAKVATTTLGLVSDATDYDSEGRITGYAAQVGGTEVFSYDLTYDALGRVNQIVERDGSTTTTREYAYTLRDWLQTVTENSVLAVSYAYDDNGNRVSVEQGTLRSASHDAQDRLLADGPASFGYSADGQLRSRTTGTDTTQYLHDEFGNLLQVQLPNGTTIEYGYDAVHRRVLRRVNGSRTQGWLYRGNAIVAELDSSDQVQTRFVYGDDLSGAPEYLIRGGTNYRLLKDHLGSVRKVIDSTTGAVVQELSFGPWGEVTLDTNPGFQPFGFAGGLFDPLSELTQFGARDYASDLGRWITRDPLGFAGGSSNLYSYTDNNPVGETDRNGLVAPVLLWGLAGALGAYAQNEYNHHGGGVPPGTSGLLLSAVNARANNLSLRAAGSKLIKNPVFLTGVVGGQGSTYLGSRLGDPSAYFATEDTFGIDVNQLTPGEQQALKGLLDRLNDPNINGPELIQASNAIAELRARARARRKALGR